MRKHEFKSNDVPCKIRNINCECEIHKMHVLNFKGLKNYFQTKEKKIKCESIFGMMNHK